MTDAPSCRLYLITPPRFDVAAFSSLLAATLDGGDIAAVQLRLKDVDEAEIARVCDVLRPIVQQRGVAFLLNDRPDLAAATGCDGVHVGQDDASYAEARKAVGANAIVGVTCHNSRHLAITAADAGADYVAFGAFFETTTKDASFRAAPELLSWWSEIMTVPCVAIGGIMVENCTLLITAGADYLAVSAGIWEYPKGPVAAVRAFNRRIAEVQSSSPR